MSICISPCGLLHLTKAQAQPYRIDKYLGGFVVKLCNASDCQITFILLSFLCRTIAGFCKRMSNIENCSFDTLQCKQFF